MVSGPLLYSLFELLLNSLTGIWAFIILIDRGSAHITHWYLALYYTQYWSFCSSHWLVSGPLLYSLLELLFKSLTGIWALLYLLLGFCSSHWPVCRPLLFCCWSSGHITDQYLALYHTYYWRFCSYHWLVSGPLLY
jgi:hypothetical protein